MRIAFLLIMTLICAAALAYAPGSNITRGIYARATPLLSTHVWAEYDTGYAFTQEAAHSGGWSVKCVYDGEGQPRSGAGVSQRVEIGQPQPAPLKIAGWSKAVGVEAEEKSSEYSLYVDLQYTDGTPWHMQIAQFTPGSHDWEYSETIIQPEKPVRLASFHAFLRGKTGTVYFDDLFFGPPDGENLLKNPGFELQGRQNFAARDSMYATLADLNADALHTYLSGSHSFWLGKDGNGNPQLRDFLSMAKDRGIGVWLTTGHPPTPPFKDADDPNFPQYQCVNGPWGEAWTRTLELAAAYDFAGISLVPDEYNWSYGRLKQSYTKHSDPRVVEFYKNLPVMCNCPVCRKLYHEQFGEELPELGPGMTFPAQTATYLQYLNHRYDSTTNWMKRSAAAIKQVNPQIRADSLICVSPICSDFWWGTGVAWQRIGCETDIDFPTTDPYIQLHNYLGDSTHWYVTETAAHLTGCTPKRQCGIVLEASRLRKEFREMDPVEIYGSALSAVCHGAKELAWWHYVHITDESHTTDRAEVSYACVRGVYELLKQADDWLGGLQPLKKVAYLHSQASDDLWRFYTQPQPANLLSHPLNDPRYAAVAQKEVLYYLFRRGVPTDLFYLEAVTEDQLRDYPVIVVPFPFAISNDRAYLLETLARQGKTVIVISEFGLLDEEGLPHETPALLRLLGLKHAPKGQAAGRLTPTAGLLPDPGDEVFTVYDEITPADGVTVLAKVEGRPVIWEHPLRTGKAIYLAGQFGYDLVSNRDNQERTRERRIIPDPIAPGHAAIMDALLLRGCGEEPWVANELPPGKDVEVTCLTNAQGDLVVLTINWEDETVRCNLRLPLVGSKPTLWGYRLRPDGSLQKLSLNLTRKGEVYERHLDLGAQEACLWRLQAK